MEIRLSLHRWAGGMFRGGFNETSGISATIAPGIGGRHQSGTCHAPVVSERPKPADSQLKLFDSAQDTSIMLVADAPDCDSVQGCRVALPQPRKSGP
jgi:hypothetical protein